MLVDLHVMAPPAGATQDWARLLRACAEAGLDGACLVGEGTTPAPDDARAAAPRGDFALFFGAAFPVGRGRLILIPASPEEFVRTLGGRAITAHEAALELARVARAALVAVHPYDRSAGTSYSDAVFHLEGLHAIEVANATRSEVANRLALEAALRLRLAPVGGTGPATAPATVGRAATAFPRPPRDQESLVEALRRGEVFPVEMSRRGGSVGQAERRRRRGRPAGPESSEGGP